MYVVLSLFILVFTGLCVSAYIYYFSFDEAADRQAAITLLTLGAVVFAGIWAARQASIVNQTLKESLKSALTVEVEGRPTLIDNDKNRPDLRTDISYMNPTKNTMNDVYLIARILVNDQCMIDISDIIGIQGMQIGPYFKANRNFPLYDQCRQRGVDLKKYVNEGNEVIMQLQYRFS